MSDRLLPDSVTPHVAEPVDELAELRCELNGIRDDLEELRAGLERDRQKVGAMLHALRAIFAGNAEPAAAAAPQNSSPRWEALKRAFPGRCADLVDTLIQHGPLSTTQIATIMRADTRTVHQLIYKLNKAGGIEKNGGKFFLKP